MKRLLLFFTYLLVVTFLLAETTLRLVSSKEGHIEYLFGKKSYFLAPFHTPDSIPSVDTTSWFKYSVYDPQLGWSIGKLGEQAPYYSDLRGFRCSQRVYDSLMQLGVWFPRDADEEYDVVCLGDSFTHGDEVDFESTWPYILGDRGGLRVLNLGVGGYGIDQAYLRYIKERPRSRVVILAMVEGDLERARSQIYSLTGGGLKTKPMFVKDATGVRLVNSPAIFGEALMREFVQMENSDFLQRERNGDKLFGRDWYRSSYVLRTAWTTSAWKEHRRSIYTNDGNDLALCIDIIDEFRRTVENEGSEFVVVLLDNLNSFIEWRSGGNPWRLLMSKLEERGIKAWHYGDSFYSKFTHDPDLIINRGLVHYTPFANAELAKFIDRNVKGLLVELGLENKLAPGSVR